MIDQNPTANTHVSLQGACPNCQAKPGEPCTQPTSTGRRAVTRFHHGRFEAGLAAGRATMEEAAR